MEQKYRIVAIGLKDGFNRAEAAQLLAALFKRPAHEVTALTIGKRVTVKKGLSLPAAVKYKAALERCGLLSEVAPETSPARKQASTGTVPLSAREIARLDTCARHILATLQEQHGSDVGYDARSIALIASDIEAGRHSYTPEQTRKISKFYGAFLGKVITDTFPHALPAWVRAPDGVAIEFRQGTARMPSLLFPLARVDQHIAQGEAMSIVACLDQLREQLNGVSEKPEQEHSTLQLPGRAGQSRLDIVMPLAMCCNCGSTDDVAVLDVELASRTKGDSAVWMELPFCGPCTLTADRVRPTAARMGMVAAGAFALTAMPAMLALSGVRVLGMPASLLVLPLFAVAAGGVLYWMHKPPAPQTSRYQPVTLDAFTHTIAGDRHVTFNFTNSEYALAFINLNKKEIAAGRIALA